MSTDDTPEDGDVPGRETPGDPDTPEDREITADREATGDSAATRDAAAPFRLAIRETEEGTLLAACDADLIGETVTEGEVSLSITAAFYGEEGADAAAVRDGLADCAVANLVGSDVVDLAIEVGVVDPANVLEIEGTPHAQAMWM